MLKLGVENGLQVIHHMSEEAKYNMTYILPTVTKTVTAKVYVIDDGDNCTMLLAEEDFVKYLSKFYW